jgi:chemosensory pili system protein ChpA (sensor histidine kinase/response regulator)
MTEIATQTVQAAAREIAQALTESRNALEAYVEQPDNVGLMQRCVNELHQARGALKLLEIHGAALLAEEMEQLGRYLLASSAEKRNQNEALDALMRAIVQLPGYLERIMAGGRDTALVLLPLLNDLRAVSGSPLLSEGTLLLLNLKSDRQAEPVAPARGEVALTVSQWARRLRARFQAGLVGWIKGERAEQQLDHLASVALRMEQVATAQCVFQLWWVVGALLEALRERGVDESVAVKRLLGLADRELKRLHEQGELRYAQAPPVELLNNLLYYVARASSSGPQVSAVRASFRLDELLPVDEQIEQERDSLSAPSVKLMQTVAAAIREDLAKVKEVLDIFVRRGGRQVSELQPQNEMLRKLGDTLGVLGLGDLRSRVQQANTRLAGVVSGAVSADPEELVQIAAKLIQVDDRLDDQLVGLIVPRTTGVGADGAEAGDSDREFMPVQAALLRECAVNLARIKESITHNVSGNLDAAGFDTWPELLRGIKAGLRMLDRHRAVEVLEPIEVHLRRVMQPGGSNVTPEYLDRLADAIVSVEYYIETIQAGRRDPWYMLDNAQRCIEAMTREPAGAIPTILAVTSPGGTTSAAAAAQTVQLTTTERAAAAASGQALADEGASTAASKLVPPPVLPAASGATSHGRTLPPADPDLVNLFIEEAHEELGQVNKYFPVWDQNPLEGAALATVRRSFHTLKGSGRMVGARSMGEFAWSVENLLNRLIEGTLTRSPAIVETLREAVAGLPLLIKQLESGDARGADLNALVARAHALAAGQESSGGATALNLPLLQLPDAAAAAAAEALAPVAATDESSRGMLPQDDITAAVPILDDEAEPPAAITATLVPKSPDTLLREIFARETTGHVATVRAWLARERTHAAPHLLPEDVYRACHTLCGSSKMAEARHGIRLAGPIEQWLRKSFDNVIGLDDSDLALLADCMTAMESVAGHLDESTGYFLVHETLRARIARAEISVERRINDAASESVNAKDASGLQPVMTAPHFDVEVAAIFAEEATELLESAQTAMLSWNDEGGSGEHVAALKRALHTLKGGARMAGIAPMGDLAHELESLLVQLEFGHTQHDEAARVVAQRGLDELARMRELVVASRAVTPATQLLEQLQRVAQRTSGDAPTEAVAVEPTAIEATAIAAEVPSVVEPAFVAETVELQIEATTIMPQAAELPPLAAMSMPPGRETAPAPERGEMARVNAELLDRLLNGAGEVSIARARLEQQLAAVDFNLGELSRTVIRLKDQLRKLELETEAQIRHRHGDDTAHRADFDPLELDRYSTIQQLSRALAESTSDVASLQQLLGTLVAEAQNQLQQQGRVVTDLQNGLMHTRMVPFSRHVQRLTRIVRQAAADSGKQAELAVEGAAGELDRQVLERMLPPLEHLLRNCVVHGIESADVRVARSKPESGSIQLLLRREGTEVIIELSDDGGGMDLSAIRAKGLAMGLITADQRLSDDDLMQLVLEPGFSTANSLTQQAGRGVGMDVVATEIKKLGGALHMQSTVQRGTQFTIRLPVTLAISHALVVRAGDEYYALPLPTIEGVVRLPREEVAGLLRADSATFSHGSHKYRLQPLAHFVGMEAEALPEQEAIIPVVLVRAGEHSTGLVADELIGSREIVVKSLGPQLSTIRGIAGATILSDGRVVVILDIGALVRGGWRGRTIPALTRDRTDTRLFVMVVDDSITVRRVTQRLLERHNMRVLTARDGMDAMSLLQENEPDILLLDIEMPRMDGYEVAAQVRADARLQHTPIIMITSRVGEKHRARAIELGVNDYLGKPYQETQLLDAINALVSKPTTS